MVWLGLAWDGFRRGWEFIGKATWEGEEGVFVEEVCCEGDCGADCGDSCEPWELCRRELPTERISSGVVRVVVDAQKETIGFSFLACARGAVRCGPVRSP